MTNEWRTTAEALAEQRRTALMETLPRALATGDTNSARQALSVTAEVDDWFASQDVIAYW
ncbi:hypothetical protein [Streptomyces sp. NPDC005231]|uniref:hypothetical protein n=1 Tax=Streptomyces sp. NPDC005231 TaxID=3157026 RepID=UPI00339DD510